MVAVDFDVLQAAAGPFVSLLGKTNALTAGTGDTYTGFDVLDRVEVKIDVARLTGERSPSLTVIVEHSDDGSNWSTAATQTFTRDGSYEATVESPQAQWRARWTVSGGMRECVIRSVTVVPGTFDPPASPGGSRPENVRRLDLGVIDASVVGDGPATLYTPDVGEVAGPAFISDLVVAGSGQAFIIGRDENVENDAAFPGMAAWDSDLVRDGAGWAANADLQMVPLTSGPITAGLNDGGVVGNPPNIYSWQASHAYTGLSGGAVSGQRIVESGHIWSAGGPGTSAASQPDFTGNLGGTVADNDIVWTDEGAIEGSAHVYVDVATPAAP